MWAGPWQQWPMQQSMYQNTPHEQVDWAALAKQWIQLNHVHKNEVPVRPADPGPVHPVIPIAVPEPMPVAQPPPVPMPLPVPPTKIPLLSDPIIPQEPSRMDVIPHAEPKVHHGTDTFLPTNSKEGHYWHGRWENDGVASESWSSQPPSSLAEESYDFGHMHGNQHLQAQSYDYNHGSDHYGYNQDFSSDSHYSQYWMDQSSSTIPPFVREENKLRTSDASVIQTEQDTIHGQLDAAKRKTLPAWIREGLEKMERQRQKKMENDKRLTAKTSESASLEEEIPHDISSRPKGYIDAEKSRFVCVCVDEERSWSAHYLSDLVVT